MDYSEFEREKKRMTEAAREEIRAMKRDGATQRAFIHALKREAVAQIQADAERERNRNAELANKKSGFNSSVRTSRAKWRFCGDGLHSTYDRRIGLVCLNPSSKYIL